MSFSLDRFYDPELLGWKAEVESFARGLAADLASRDRGSQFSHEDWRACAGFGLLGLCLPEQYGGRGKDLAYAVLAMEGLGKGCRDNGLALALNAQVWTTQMSIHEFGTEEQRERWLPDLCAGRKIAAQAVTEPESGSDAYALQTTATKVDGGYRLDGEKILVTLGPVADLFLVLATLDPSLGQWGVTAFAIPRGSPGLEIHEADEKMGLRTVPLGALTLESCFVPEADRLGAEGGGAALSSASLEYERGPMLASQIGMLEYQLETCVAYAKDREQFGRPIGNFQTISNRIAEMKMRLEAARAFVYRVAWHRAHGRKAVMDAAMAKFQLGEALVASSLDAVRIHGGRGYLTENGIERDLRDAVGTVLYGGTSDIQRIIIARLLGLRP